MGIGYLCDSALGCTFVVWDGDVTPQQWHDHFDRMFADPAFPPGPRALADFQTAGGAPSITDDAMREIGERWNAEAEGLPPMRFALVPNGAWDKAQYVVEQEITAPRFRFILFNDLYTACTWLGVAPEKALSIVNDLRTRLRVATK